MLINTTDYPGHKTSYSSQDAISEDTCRVRVVSIDNYPVQGILVESKNSSGKVLNAGVTDSNGSVIFTDFDKIGKITAFAMGYHPITFDFSMGKDYIIKIAENDIIENRTVAFRINIIDDKSFSILLLSDDLKTNKDLEKELTKLNKRASKSNLIEKRFTKELPIFIR
jgi:hypothetical protein